MTRWRDVANTAVMFCRAPAGPAAADPGAKSCHRPWGPSATVAPWVPTGEPRMAPLQLPASVLSRPHDCTRATPPPSLLSRLCPGCGAERATPCPHRQHHPHPSRGQRRTRRRQRPTQGPRRGPSARAAGTGTMPPREPCCRAGQKPSAVFQPPKSRRPAAKRAARKQPPRPLWATPVVADAPPSAPCRYSGPSSQGAAARNRPPSRRLPPAPRACGGRPRRPRRLQVTPRHPAVAPARAASGKSAPRRCRRRGWRPGPGRAGPGQPAR
mmetsp:Transcript_65734/g.140619  ORF Transcript_65734/g.140619 Transcript_65734/m.140619 type:complete len:269 (+) Transcript_65734:80-886(+)